MVPQSSRPRKLAPPARRRPAGAARLRCEPLEDRVTPALFTAQPPPNIAGLNNNGCVAVGDFNHDGYMDAVFTNEGTDFNSAADNRITILYGKATGGFTTVNVNTGGTNVSFVTAVDINGDGWLDLVCVNENNAGNNSSTNLGSFSVFQNNARAGAFNAFTLKGTYSTASVNPSWVGLADVTGDGVKDVVVGAFGPLDAAGQNVNGKITIFQGNPDASGHGD
ncbi:MAG TPA: VCBS repeat-containing protein, partial [Gemmataceae bacterium]|nr:VCBS repeat-containing protein [Gemmataceae bacterium]